MGATQSSVLPETRVKRQSLNNEERERLVTTNENDYSTDEIYPSGKQSPRAVNRFSNSTPDSSHSELLHDEISAITLNPAVSTVVECSREIEVDKTFSILLLMSDTGGGHRASAQALEAALTQQYPHAVEIHIVDFWTKVAGFPFHNFPAQYAYIAKRPILWKAVYLWALFKPTRWLTEMAFSLFCHARVRRYFQKQSPDMIVSVHPLVNTLSLSVLAYMRRLYGRPTPPFVTVVTDLGGAHPTWFDPRSDLVYVPSEPLYERARENGIQEDRIRLLGLPIRSSFWEENRSREELRQELGMAQTMPAVLLVGGGDGVGGLEAIASAIAIRIAEEAGSTGGQLVVVCGKNKALLNKLQARSWPIPVILKGFVSNMSEWMSACNILCSKAGPGTIAEAWIRGLPIILTGYLPGQEEGNVKLVTESGSGEFHNEPEMIAKCATKWVTDPELRGAIAARAKSLGRPSSTKKIAGDIWQIGQEHLKMREAFQRRLLLSPTQHIPNGYIAMTRYYIGSGLRSIQRGFNAWFGITDVDLDRPRE